MLALELFTGWIIRDNLTLNIPAGEERDSGVGMMVVPLTISSPVISIRPRKNIAAEPSPHGLTILSPARYRREKQGWEATGWR